MRRDLGAAWRRSRVVLVAVTVTLAIGACTDKKPTATPTGAASTAPSVDPTAAARADAEQKVLAAYNAYVATYHAAGAAPDSSNTKDLEKYVAEPLLSRLRDNVEMLASNHLVVQGDLKNSPKVGELQIQSTPPVATIDDCYDITTQRVVDTRTGARRDPTNQPLRYKVTSHATYYNDQIGWLIDKSDPHRDQPC